MNRERRKKLAVANSFIDKALEIIDQVRDEEQEAFDNLPEGLQMGQNGMSMEEKVDGLENIYMELEDIKTSISDL